MSRKRKNKSKPAAAKTRSRGPSIAARGAQWIQGLNWSVLRQSGTGVTWVAVIGGVAAAWTLGVPRLQAFASQRQAVDPHNVTIRFSSPPPWLQGDIANKLLRTATMQLGGDPLKRDDLVAVRESLLQTGWFDGIDQVRRVETDLVQIDARFVQPYTMIRDSKGDHLVDVTGRLLPMSYDQGKGPGVIALTGAHFARPVKLGDKWEGSDVQAGLSLLRLLEHQPWRSQVAEIDVSAYLNRAVVRLRTTTGSVIVWGGAPGEEPALEVLAEGKVARLGFLYQTHGRIDGGNSGELDITGEKAVVLRSTDS